MSDELQTEYRVMLHDEWSEWMSKEDFAKVPMHKIRMVETRQIYDRKDLHKYWPEIFP